MISSGEFYGDLIKKVHFLVISAGELSGGFIRGEFNFIIQTHVTRCATV